LLTLFVNNFLTQISLKSSEDLTIYIKIKIIRTQSFI